MNIKYMSWELAECLPLWLNNIARKWFSWDVAVSLLLLNWVLLMDLKLSGCFGVILLEFMRPVRFCGGRPCSMSAIGIDFSRFPRHNLRQRLLSVICLTMRVTGTSLYLMIRNETVWWFYDSDKINLYQNNAFLTSSSLTKGGLQSV